MKNNLLFLAFLLLFAAGCKKEKNALNNNTPQTITPEKTEVYPMEVVYLKADGVKFNSETYTGSFNNETVQLFAVDNVIGFVVPKGATGSGTLNTTVEGISLNISYSVKAPVSIGDANAYIETNLIQNLGTDEYLDAAATMLSSMPGGSNAITDHNELKSLKAEFVSALVAASQQEKEELAMFIAANPDLFIPMDNVLNYYDTLLHSGKITMSPDLENHLNELQQTAKKTRVTIAATAVLAVSMGILGGPLVGLGTAVFVCKKLYDANDKLIVKLAETIECFGNDLIGNTGNKGTAQTDTFNSGTPYPIRLKGNYKNVNKESLNTGSLMVNSISNDLTGFGDIWNKIISKLPKSLNGKPVHPSNISETKSKRMEVNAKYLRIENVSNNKVSVSQDKSTGYLQATFTTTESTPQSFTYDVVYELKDHRTFSVQRQGVIIGQDPIVGAWVGDHQWYDENNNDVFDAGEYEGYTDEAPPFFLSDFVVKKDGTGEGIIMRFENAGLTWQKLGNAEYQINIYNKDNPTAQYNTQKAFVRNGKLYWGENQGSYWMYRVHKRP